MENIWFLKEYAPTGVTATARNFTYSHVMEKIKNVPITESG